jgi:hypothetical protein
MRINLEAFSSSGDAGRVVLASELLFVNTARGKEAAAGRLAAELEQRLSADLPVDVALTGFRALARLAADHGDARSALRWMLRVYDLASDAYAEPSSRILSEGIDLLNAARGTDSVANVIAEFGAVLHERARLSDDSAVAAIDRVRPLLLAQRVNEALRTCEFVLDQVDRLSPMVQAHAFWAYGHTLIPLPEATSPLLAAAELFENLKNPDYAAWVWDQVGIVAEAIDDRSLQNLATIRGQECRRTSTRNPPRPSASYRPPPPEAPGPDASRRHGL